MRKSKLPGFTGSFDFGILPKLRYFNTHIFLKRTIQQHDLTTELTPRGNQARRAYLSQPYANLRSHKEYQKQYKNLFFTAFL